MLLFYSILFIVSFLVLAKSGGMLVGLTSKISAFLEVSEFLFSFVIIGIATSLPEIFISVSASFFGNSAIVFGNVVGSNILYPTLLIGVTVLAAGRLLLMDYKETVNKTNIYVYGISLLPLALMWDLTLSRMEGIVLIGIFVFYIADLVRRRDSFPREYDINGKMANSSSVKAFFKNASYFMLGVILLYISSNGVVISVSAIVKELNLSLIFISIFIVAFGAALPEIVFSVQAALQRKKELIMGNMLGSLVVNSALGLGLASVINPVILNNAKFFYISALFAFLSLFFLGIFTKTQNSLSRKEGIFLILLYVLFVVIEFMAK